MTFVLCAVCCLFILQSLHRAVYADSIKVNEDFESLEIGAIRHQGEWLFPDPTVAKGTMTGVRTSPTNNGKSLCISNVFGSAEAGADWFQINPYISVDPSLTMVISCDFYIPSNKFTTSDYFFFQVHMNGSNLLRPYGLYGGSISPYKVPGRYTEQSFDTWFTVKTVINLAAFSYDIYYSSGGGAEEKILSQPIGFSGNLDNALQVRCMSSIAATTEQRYIYLDNLNIYTHYDKPVVSDVEIQGEARPDSAVTGFYTYPSSGANPEQGSTYRWLVSNAPAGKHNPANLTYTPIACATYKLYR